jgi:hypothetical protein
VREARSGNISGALRSYQACGLPALQARCRDTAQKSAPGAAESAALKGNCKQAASIVAAAKAMGASSPKLDSALSKCK